MGFCSRRHFLLTICTLQLLTTIERQVFDFLGFMWAPILVNFFNIIFVILGFFGTFQYRPKYLITYCIWDTLWLGWNIFCICFYLDVGILDKTSDILNLGTGSFSWWLANGPGCKADYNYTEPELFRPERPTNVTGCVLNYEVIEVLHASTQCLLACLAIVGGICLSRAYLEEDDSFDFVGGGDFGLAGHTPLHPMYVSYSALPPPATLLPQSNNQNYQSYLRTGTTDSNKSSYYTLGKNGDKFVLNHQQNRVKSQDTARSNKSTTSTRVIENIDYYNDYSNPVDHLHRPVSPLTVEYDSVSSSMRSKFEKNQPSRCYSPVVSPVLRRARPSQAPKQNRNSFKPRVFTDFVREQPLRSFYSDPRLAMEQQQNNSDEAHRNSRPISLYASKL